MHHQQLENNLDKLDSVQEIKLLESQGKLFWRGKKVIVDPFTPADFFYEITTLDDGTSVVKGKLIIGGKESDLEACDGVFPGCVVHHHLLRFTSADWKWVQMVPKKLSGLEHQEFEKLCKDPGAPKIVWKNRPDPIPFLVLKDRTGAFADLWMDYRFHKVAMGVDMKPIEKAWEKDLLETDYIKKQVGSSHYYCPVDKISKSLTFLMEIGWTILDIQGKRILRQGKPELSVDGQGEKIVLRGKIPYGEFKADLTQVIKGQTFVDLSPTSVGLIEMPKEWRDLDAEEIIKEGVAVRRAHFGVLESVVQLPQEYKIAAWEETPPGVGFHGTLYRYQQEGVNWLSFLYRSKFHGLLADEMGLGKTVQLLAFFSTISSERPILIVMPTSLVFNWKREFEKFLPGREVSIYAGKDRTLADRGIILTSYAILRQDRDLLSSLDYECVVLDEGQAIKNPKSLVSQIVCQLRANFRIVITGTPIENRFEDLASIFRFVMPELQLERPERIKKKIRPFTLRRLKDEVGLQLPPKQEQIVWVEMEEAQKTFYETFLMQSRQIRKESRMEILEAILRLRQICCHPVLFSGEYAGESSKLERLLSDLEEVSGHKVLVYSQFTSMLKLIEKEVQARGSNYVYLDGQTKDRETPVSKFQEDPDVHIFLISLKAGGVGLNLTAADYVFLFDPWWNEAVERQAIDRAHRLGREKPVIARRYITASSIEEKILRLKEHKVMLAKDILDFDQEVGPLTNDELYDLIAR